MVDPAGGVAAVSVNKNRHENIEQNVPRMPADAGPVTGRPCPGARMAGLRLARTSYIFRHSGRQVRCGKLPDLRHRRPDNHTAGTRPDHATRHSPGPTRLTRHGRPYRPLPEMLAGLPHRL